MADVTTGLGDALLATPEGTAFLACGAAVGRLEGALADPGLTLCLAAHALGEVRRGTDGGRILRLGERPGRWLLDAARTLDDADTSWWRDAAAGRVLRHRDGTTAGVEVIDAVGRARSAPEEADPHLHTFTSRDPRTPVRRHRLPGHADVLTLVAPGDVDDDVVAALGPGAPSDAPGVDLTLQGALTIPRSLLPHWPWEVAGVHWAHGVPRGLVDEGAAGPAPRVVHDHGWPPIGRPHDPRFDEGDEVDGSELDRAG